MSNILESAQTYAVECFDGQKLVTYTVSANSPNEARNKCAYPGLAILRAYPI